MRLCHSPAATRLSERSHPGGQVEHQGNTLGFYRIGSRGGMHMAVFELARFKVVPENGEAMLATRDDMIREREFAITTPIATLDSHRP